MTEIIARNCSFCNETVSTCEECLEHIDEEGFAIHGCDTNYHEVDCSTCLYATCDGAC